MILVTLDSLDPRQLITLLREK